MLSFTSCSIPNMARTGSIWQTRPFKGGQRHKSSIAHVPNNFWEKWTNKHMLMSYTLRHKVLLVVHNRTKRYHKDLKLKRWSNHQIPLAWTILATTRPQHRVKPTHGATCHSKIKTLLCKSYYRRISIATNQSQTYSQRCQNRWLKQILMRIRRHQ